MILSEPNWLYHNQICTITAKGIFLNVTITAKSCRISGGRLLMWAVERKWLRWSNVQTGSSCARTSVWPVAVPVGEMSLHAAWWEVASPREI